MKILVTAIALIMLQIANTPEVKSALARPIPDSECFASPARLGTDNMPVFSDGFATTIVNIGAYVPLHSASAALWIYTTKSNGNWAQINFKWRTQLRAALGNADYSKIEIKGFPASRGSVPVQLSSKESALIRARLSRAGMKFQPCFESPLPKRYLR